MPQAVVGAREREHAGAGGVVNLALILVTGEDIARIALTDASIAVAAILDDFGRQRYTNAVRRDEGLPDIATLPAAAIRPAPLETRRACHRKLPFGGGSAPLLLQCIAIVVGVRGVDVPGDLDMVLARCDLGRSPRHAHVSAVVTAWRHRRVHARLYLSSAYRTVAPPASRSVSPIVRAGVRRHSDRD